MYEQEYEDNYQEPARPMPFISPANQMGSAITTLTNPSDDLYKIELGLRNCIIDKDGNAKKVGQPLLNEDGVSSVISQAGAILNQITSMSNLGKKEEVVNMLDFLADSLAQDLMMNSRNYGINKKSANPIRTKIYFMALAPS